MKKILGALLLFSLALLAMATQVDSISDLECNCMILRPTLGATSCRIPESQGLDWNTALSFASRHRIGIQFVDEHTASKVLKAKKPLPTGVLQRLSDGSLLPHPENMPDGEEITRVICSIRDEMRQGTAKASDLDSGPSNWFVVQVILFLVLFIVVYEAGETVWMKIQKIFFPKPAPIRLTGDEKVLTAGTEVDTCSTSGSEQRTSKSILPS